MNALNRATLAAVCIAAVLAAGGCTYVKLQTNAEEVAVLDERRAEKCEKIGETRVSVAERVGFVARGDKAIAEDLEILARNSAADMGGDTVAPLGEVQDGKQQFGVYNCLED